MIFRSRLAGLLAALTAVGLGSIGGTQAQEPSASVPPPSILDIPADACGPGLKVVVMPAIGRVSCVHATPDPAPPVIDARSDETGAGTGGARKAPVCFGNGVDGRRIELVFAYPEGFPNRLEQALPIILDEIVPSMEGTIRATSALGGRDLGLRLHMPGCKLDRNAVRVVEVVPEGPGGSAGMGQIVSAVAATGQRVDRKYHIWYDGPGGCGIAEMLPIDPVTDAPGPQNPHNNLPVALPGVDGVLLMPQYAVTYGAPRDADIGIGQGCWGNIVQGGHTEIHELMHTFGAVQLTAPNSNEYGHCTDEPDIMCYPEQGVRTVKRCFGSIEFEILDCNGDDYFNAAPATGSYLSTHWNTADSMFLGDAVTDAVPVPLPEFP